MNSTNRYLDTAKQLLSPTVSKVLVLNIILLITSLARLSDMKAKSAIYHDESISYLIAGCHNRDLSQMGATVEPTIAGDWKAPYTMVDQSLCFAEIADAARTNDTHPPFYYWLLHLWSMLTGVTLWTGPALNLLIALVTVIVLFLAARDLLGNNWEALFVAAVYALLPPVVHISAEARQYQLLALLTILTIWLTIRMTRRSSGYSLVESGLLSVTVFAGALTHYQFVLVVAGAAVYATVKLVRRDLRRLAIVLAALLAGYLLAGLVFPMADIVLTRANNNQSGFQTALLNGRLGRLKMAATAFNILWYGFILCLVAVIVRSAVLLFSGGRGKLYRYFRETNWRGAEVLFFLLWMVGWILLLYLAFISPRHAMGPKYFTMALPLVSFVPVFFLRLLRYPWVLVLYFPLVALIFLAGDVQNNMLAPEFHFEQTWETDDIVLIDNRARGILPQILWHLPAEQRVIVGYQDFLLENFSELNRYLGQTVVYVSENSYGNSNEKRQQLLELLQQEGYLLEGEVASIPIRSGIARGNTPVYLLSRGD